MRRIFLTFFLTLLFLAVVTAATAWFLLRDEVFLKSRISDFVFKQTGRELAINGSLRLDLGRETSLEARDLIFQNADWADQATMASVGRLLITIDLSSLFGDVSLIPLLIVENCTIKLVRNDEGEANWDLLPEPASQIEPAPALPDTLPVLLRDIQIRNCSLDFDSPDRDQPLIAEVGDISLQTSLNNRVEGSGHGRIDGEALSFSGGYSPFGVLALGGSLEYDLNLQLGDISLQSSGRLEDAARLTGANLKTRFHGPEFGWVLETFSLPPLSEGPFDFHLDLDTEGRMTKLDLDGDLGKLSINASGELDRLAQPQFGNVTLDMKGPDLEALGAAFDVSGLVPEPFSLQGNIAFDKGVSRAKTPRIETLEDRLEVSGVLGTAPDFTDSSLNFSLSSKEAGRWRGRLGLPTSLRGSLQIDGVLSSDAEGIFSAQAALKNTENSVEISGILGSMEGGFQPDIEVGATSTDLQSLGWLAGIENLPAAAVSAHGHVRISGRKIHLQAVNIDLAAHSALINGLVNLKDNYGGSRLDIEVESPDIAELGQLFAYDNLPRLPLSLKLSLKPEGKGLAFLLTDGRLGEIKLSLDGRVVELENPLGVDTIFDIQHHGRFQLVIEAGGLDASMLEEWVGFPLAPDTFSLKARLSGNSSEFELTGLDFRLGKSVVGGQLKFGLGEFTRISGRLDFPFLDLSRWAADEGEKSKRATVPSGYVFDDTPVMEIANYGVIADLDLSITRLNLGNTELREIELGLDLDPNRLELNPLVFKGSTGGRISGSTVLDNSAGVPRLDFKLSGRGLYLGFASMEGQDPATFPPLDIDLTLAGSGVTQHELASSLNGKVRANYQSGLVASSGLSMLFSDFATELFSTLNPFQKPTEYTELSCAVLAADVSDGMVKIFPTIIQTAQVTILSQGAIDLSTEKIDLSFNTKTRKGLGLSVSMLINPFIKVGGRLAAPILELDPAGSVVSGGIAVATLGISLVAKSMLDRFLSSKDPCGDALEEIARMDGEPD